MPLMGSPKISHVFVVGTARSGTSMLRHVLNRSDQLAILNESHFFGNPRTLRYLFDLIMKRPARKVQDGLFMRSVHCMRRNEAAVLSHRRLVD